MMLDDSPALPAMVYVLFTGTRTPVPVYRRLWRGEYLFDAETAQAVSTAAEVAALLNQYLEQRPDSAWTRARVLGGN